ncbi:hypothetical protein EZV62_000882 [Acer yangbiense]|uniref:Tetrahydrofolate dehydrogenase/cyclohydrolase NAD(P)-binding domain-containing protein n=1 Tax=Acer yangbiense TaxID=1000413 RepID=A0A5C7ISC6_9ROSI|nr:hypothetical protein EZV62_000882 [Acer yangbiense]
MKRKACAEVGIKSFDINLLEQVSEAHLISKVHELNAMTDVHRWFLVQLLLPKHINEEKVLTEISLEKDIKGSWIKPGAAVIDVGTSAIDDLMKKTGYRLVGDVHFKEACTIAGWITPVPSGVGPMTVAMLLRNTLDGAKRVIEL